MASTTMIETVTITRPLKTHGNLTASYLWQPGEFVRRMLGERPAPVPPTRDLWPQQQQLSISTLQVAYLQEEPQPRRASTLPPQPYVPTTVPIEHEHHEPRRRVCTVGTNTDPPPTILSRFRSLVKKQEDIPIGCPPPVRLTAVPRETAIDGREDENPARKALNSVMKAISGAKYRIAPGTETVDSPKIVYEMPKPGDRMTTTFGARESQRKWCKLPSKATCSKRIRSVGKVGSWCIRRPPPPPRRQVHPPRLQITQV